MKTKKLEQLDKEDTIKETESVDIFQWANLTDGIKNDLDVEFFLFNKSFIPFTTRFAGELNVQIKPLFLFDLINFVNMGAGTGLAVRDYEMDTDKEAFIKNNFAKSTALLIA